MARQVANGGRASEKTLRDEFAGMAMTGLLAGSISKEGAGAFSWGEIAEGAFTQADAMLAERGESAAAERPVWRCKHCGWECEQGANSMLATETHPPCPNVVAGKPTHDMWLVERGAKMPQPFPASPLVALRAEVEERKKDAVKELSGVPGLADQSVAAMWSGHVSAFSEILSLIDACLAGEGEIPGGD